MINVVLVDDQAVVRAGFRVLLEEESDIAVVGEASGGQEAVSVVRRTRPDVVCMDLGMPAGDGLTATRQIVADRTDDKPAVLVVTTFDLDADVFGALEAGADGFILKDCEPEELVDAVRRLAAGYGLVDQSVTRRVIAEFARRQSPAESPAEMEQLTARELEIVKLLAQGMSNAEIAAGQVGFPRLDRGDELDVGQQVKVGTHCIGGHVATLPQLGLDRLPRLLSGQQL
ncbi:MAG: response regulator transcription factor [Propionibacteriaceae bacterium]|nr:response regulator transcription factor [Propionibacteriaceae bacterium]